MTVDRERSRRSSPLRAIAWRHVWTGVLLTGLLSSGALHAGPPAPLGASHERLLGADTPGTSEIMPVPAELQVPLILKILTYDRNFQSKAQTELRVGIVFMSGNPASLKAKNDIVEVFRGFSDKTVRKLAIRHSAVEYVSDSQVEEAARSNQFNIFYVAPGNAGNLETLLRISQARQIITTTGVPAYVDKGIAVGVGVEQDKPHILINLASSKAEGSEFDASLLRIARVVR
jgi:hypothetical protein